MTNYRSFELHRLSDDLVYRFDRLQRPDGSIGYKRRDGDLWITFERELSWVSRSAIGELTGRPWDQRPDQQRPDHPPAGIWVSGKGVKSYVYELRYASGPKS